LNLKSLKNKFTKYFHTIRYLRPKQIVGRIVFKIRHPKPSLKKVVLRELTKKNHFPLLKNKSMIHPTKFTFLNAEYNVDSKEIWNNKGIQKLWLYNLHYFDDLNATDSISRKTWHSDFIARWINENPVGYGVGWDPYPLSLRIVNLIKWHSNGNILSDEVIQNLAIQVRFLRKRLEYHLLGNHLFANAKALFFAGLFFKGKEAEQWLKKGFSLLKKEINEQILADGGNYERSPMYHSIMLEDMLDIITIAEMYDHPLLTESTINYWKEITKKMLIWLQVMCHGDGRIALFNDAAFGIAPELKQLKLYAKNLKCDKDTRNEFIDLTNTGYIRVQNEKYLLLIDAGDVGPDYQPGHAHADTFSFELSKGEQRIIVDSGTSCYGTWCARQRQRSTSAHNTLSIDGENSSDVWSGFRVAKRAKIVNRAIVQKGDEIIVSASHNGYKRIKKVGNHERKWSLKKEKIVIEDTIFGSGLHKLELSYHFHPELSIKNEDKILNICCLESTLLRMYFEKDIEYSIIDTTYHPEFGKFFKAKKIVVSLVEKLPFTLTTIIEV
jgi:uncharacterized heparinase superfamily protein